MELKSFLCRMEHPRTIFDQSQATPLQELKDSITAQIGAIQPECCVQFGGR